MLFNNRSILKLSAIVATISGLMGSGVVADDEKPQLRALGFGNSPTLRQRLRRCENYLGQGLQKFTFVPPDFLATQDPFTLKPGDMFVSIVDKPLFDLVAFGINTCQIVSINGPGSPFPSYELSCHLMARSPDGDTFTASGDGEPNLFLDDPQLSKYAITGGTGEFLGAWGQFEFVFDQLSIDPDSGFPISAFDFNLTLCI